MNTYIVPVELKMVNHLIVQASTQAEAVKKVKETIDKKKEYLAIEYDSAKILESDIICDKDEEMLENFKNDLSEFIDEEELDHCLLSTISIKSGDKNA